MFNQLWYFYKSDLDAIFWRDTAILQQYCRTQNMPSPLQQLLVVAYEPLCTIQHVCSTRKTTAFSPRLGARRGLRSVPNPGKQDPGPRAVPESPAILLSVWTVCMTPLSRPQTSLQSRMALSLGGNHPQGPKLLLGVSTKALLLPVQLGGRKLKEWLVY